MASTRARGTNAVRYGTMRENVLALEGGAGRRPSDDAPAGARANPPPATISRGCSSARRARSASSPRSRSGCISASRKRSRRRCAPFPTSLEAAVDTVIRTIQSGIPVARIELLDEVMMDAVNRYSKLDYAEQPTLFIEFHGSAAAVAEQAELRAGDRRASTAAATFAGRCSPEERSRAVASARTTPTMPAWRCGPARGRWPTDVSRADLAPRRMHRRDAGGHRRERPHGAASSAMSATATSTLPILVDPSDADGARARRGAATTAWSTRALALDGTCTGEHGIGTGKIAFSAS